MYKEQILNNLSEDVASASNLKVPAAMLIGGFSLLVFLILPSYIGALAGLGFNDNQLGYLASMDLAGITTASLISVLFIKKINWRILSLTSLIALIGLNMFCINQNDYPSLLTLRFCSGVAGGLVLVISYSVISASRDPDRNIAIFVATQVLFQTIGFLCVPQLTENWGVNGFYWVFSVASVIGLVLVPLLPAKRHDENPTHKVSDKTKALPTFLILIAMTLFFSGQGSIWGFGEIIGQAGGLSSAETSNALAFTSFTALFGAGLAAWMSNRFGRFWPILVAIAVQCAMTLNFHGEMSATYYLIVFAIFSFGWNFGISFQVGALCDTDPEGRFAALVPAFQGAGLAIGPALGGAFLTGDGYYTVNLISFFALVLYLVLILPFTRNRAA